MFTPGDRVLVAVSGGPDSVCLLHALHMLRRQFRITLEVFHFDHGLRPDSAKDVAYVRRLAAKLRLPIHVEAADSKPAKGESVEAWARTVRWEAANRIRRDNGFRAVGLAHTLDDQAETLLLAMLRGGGLHFVAGMSPNDGHFTVRPLLDVRRAEVEAFDRALHLRPRIDPTNRDRALLRNAIRLDVIPTLEKATDRDVRGTLARTAALLRADADELLRQGTKAFGSIAASRDGGYVIDAAKLSQLPEAIAGRVVELAMWQSGVRPELETIRAVLDLAGGRPGRRIDLPGGFTAARDREYIRLSSPGTP
jgi:tRNA(Ile)-lysidine synthase